MSFSRFWFGVLVLCLALWSMLPAHAANPASEELEMTFSGLPVGLFAEFCAEHVFQKPVVVLDGVEADGKQVRLRSGKMVRRRAGELCRVTLKSYGIDLVEVDGMVQVKRLEGWARSSWVQVLYAPKFRPIPELVAVAKVFAESGVFADVGEGTREVLFYGPRREAEAITSVIERVDRPLGRVLVRGAVVEFSRGADKGSAIQALGSLLGGRLTANVTPGSLAGQALGVVVGGLEVTLSMLDADTRFRLVSRPEVVVMDGAEGKFSAVEERRVLGGVTVGAGGAVVQAREVTNAGITLTVGVKLGEGTSQVTFNQAVSQFSGVFAGEPVTLRREVGGKTVLRGGEVLVVGGLNESRNDQAERRLFGWKLGDSATVTERELLFFLQLVDV